MTQKKNVTWFVIITLVISWPLMLLPLAFPHVPAVAGVAWMLAMFGPGLAAIIVTRFIARDSLGTLNLKRLGPKRFYAWAWVLPPVLAVVALAFTLLFGVGTFDTSFSLIREALPQEPLPVPVELVLLG